MENMVSRSEGKGGLQGKNNIQSWLPSNKKGKFLFCLEFNTTRRTYQEKAPATMEQYEITKERTSARKRWLRILFQAPISFFIASLPHHKLYTYKGRDFNNVLVWRMHRESICDSWQHQGLQAIYLWRWSKNSSHSGVTGWAADVIPNDTKKFPVENSKQF